MARDPDPYVMYIVVDKTLDMNRGKVGASCGHAVMMLMLEHQPTHPVERQLAFQHWLEDDHPAYPKIVLGASPEEFAQVLVENELHFLVIDRGFAAVAPDSRTAIGLWPCRKSQASPIVKTLKPLR
jgi:peptidyl-tRNA hydrolase